MPLRSVLMYQFGRKVLIGVDDLDLRLRIAAPETLHLFDVIHEDNPSGKTLVPDDGQVFQQSGILSNIKIVSMAQEVSSRATSTKIRPRLVLQRCAYNPR
jgi:hypothetical protein